MATSAAVGFVGFNVALLSAHLMQPPPSLFDPQCSKFFGRWLYLTYQSNIMGVLYFSLALVDAVLIGAEGVLTEWLTTLFPLMFAEGTFLTLAYYALDHFNPENRRRKDRLQAGYPLIWPASHLEHGHALPLVVMHGAMMTLPSTVPLPTNGTVAASVGAYLLFYLLLVHLNYHKTGLWPYPVIDDVTRTGGSALRGVFFLGLMGVFFAFGVAGAAVLRMR